MAVWFRWLLLSQALAPTLLGGCSRFCTADTYNAVGVRVRDAHSGDAICDAEVTASLNNQPPLKLDTLEFPDGCAFIGGGSKGTYRVEARRAGYLPAAVRMEVDEDECGRPETESHTFVLERDPNARPVMDGGADGG